MWHYTYQAAEAIQSFTIKDYVVHSCIERQFKRFYADYKPWKLKKWLKRKTFYRNFTGERTLTISKHVLKWIRSAEKVSENIEGIPEYETLESELVEIVCVVILAAGMTWTCWWTVGFKTFNAELIIYFALFVCNWIKITITSKIIFLELPGISTLTGFLGWKMAKD